MGGARTGGEESGGVGSRNEEDVCAGQSGGSRGGQGFEMRLTVSQVEEPGD